MQHANLAKLLMPAHVKAAALLELKQSAVDQQGMR